MGYLQNNYLPALQMPPAVIEVRNVNTFCFDVLQYLYQHCLTHHTRYIVTFFILYIYCEEFFHTGLYSENSGPRSKKAQTVF